MTIKKRIISAIIISLIIMTMLSAVATVGPLLANAASTNNTFGYTEVGEYTDRTPAGHKDSSRYQAPENGIITSISMYIQTGNAQIRYGVYNDNNGKPGQLLGQSDMVTTTANSWVSAPLSVPIVAGQYYWLTITANSMVYWNCGFGGSAGNGFEPTATLSANYGEFIPWGTAKFSMYATYMPTAITSPTITPTPTQIATPTPSPVSTPTPTPVTPTPTPTPTASQPSNIPAGLTLKYQTNFETVTKASSSSLNMGISNYFEFQGSSGASMWVEGLDRTTSGIKAHSGTRCIGLEVTNIASARRAEFNLYKNAVGLGDRFYISEYIYLPSSFTVTNDGYYDLFQASSDTGTACPMYSLMISGENSDGTFNILLFGRDASANKMGNDGIITSISHFNLPRGQWFKLEWYQVNSSNGVIQAWINGQQIINYHGYALMTGNYYLSTDIYYNADDTSVHRMWVDDLAIYG